MNTDEAAQSVGPKGSIFNRLLGVPDKQAFADLQQENEAKEARLAEAKIQEEQLRAENEKLTAERDALSAELKNLSEQLQEQGAVMGAKNEKLSVELNGLKAENDSAAESARAQHLALRHLKEQLEEANAARVAAAAENRSLTDAVGRQKGDIEKAKAALAATQTELEQCSAKIVKLQNSLEARDRAGNTLEALRGEMKILEDRRKSLCAELKSALGQIGESGAATGRPAHDIATLVTKVRGIRSSVDALEKQRTKIEAETEGLERKIDKTSTRLLATEDTLAKRKSACEEKQRQVSELQTASVQLKTEIKALESTFAARRRQLDEEYARDTAALADLKQSMMEEIDRSRKEQEASLPEARLRELEIKEQETRALYDEAARKRKSAESRLAQAKEEAQQIRDQADKALQRARTKARDLASEAEDMMSAAKAKQRGVAQKRRELASMPDKVEALSEANKRLKEIIARQKKDLQATGGKSELNQTIRELERDFRKLSQANEKLTEKLEKETERVHTLTLQGKVRRESVDGGFLSGYETAQEWMLSCGDSGRQHDWSRNIVTLGSGPFPDHLLDYELRKRKHLPCEPGVSNAEVMIVGRIGCSMNKIEQHIRCMEGGRLRIYSQEMAVLAMMTGADPFDADESVLMDMGRSHPILRELMEDKFEWPSLHRRRSAAGAVIEIAKWNSLSPLTAMGYHTGREFTDARERRERLADIVEGRLVFPDGFGAQRKNEWGLPSSRQRIKKVALQLVQNISLPGQSPFLGLAAEHWESDYEWLKKHYPKGGSGGWPRL